MMLNYRLMPFVMTTAWFFVMAISGHVATGASVRDDFFVRGLTLGMTTKAVLETIGAPEQVKSEGRCYAYPRLGVSVFFDEKQLIRSIYLGPRFRGTITTPLGENLSFQNAHRFLTSTSTSDLTYTPSLLINNRATVEVEKSILSENPPLEYRGNGQLYRLHGSAGILKYKYVEDRQGLALYFDENGNCYTIVLFSEHDAHKQIVQEPSPATIVSVERKTPIHFDFDKAVVRPKDYSLLDAHIGYLSNNPSARMIIEGHTDSIGSEEYNQKLSVRRSRAAYDYMVRKGVDPQRLQTIGYGESRPVAENKTPVGRAQNRRAEFVVHVIP